MPGAAETRIVVRGKEEVEAALLQLRREVITELKPALREAAEPVRSDAQARATGEITNIGPRWSQMRVGVTSKTVYVAPKARRRGGSPRPNLGGLLFRVMSEALDANQEKITLALDVMVTESAARAGFF